MDDTTSDFLRIVIEDITLLDVRAPVEFIAGAFPNAVNIPLMNNEERHQVGTCYKKEGRSAAIRLGHQLVNGETKDSRIAAWQDFITQQPDTLLYCARGGLRSQLAQQWIKETTGKRIQRLAGGYKAFRNYLISRFDQDYLSSCPIIVGGRTGAGKTLILHQLKNFIDLEALTNHRGSTFGRHLTPQPSQIDFENRLAYRLIKHAESGFKSMVLESEGSFIGKRYIPANLVDFFSSGSLVILETPLEQRIQITFDEYVISDQADYVSMYGAENGIAQWLEDMNKSVDRIRKRLGSERQTKVKNLLQDACDKQQRSADLESHKAWIEILIREYYDPMYDYQIKKKTTPIAFKGNHTEVLTFLKAFEQNPNPEINKA